MFECQCYEKWTCSTGISVASTFFLLLLTSACDDGERKKIFWEKSGVLYITNLYISQCCGLIRKRLWIQLMFVFIKPFLFVSSRFNAESRSWDVSSLFMMCISKLVSKYRWSDDCYKWVLFLIYYTKHYTKSKTRKDISILHAEKNENENSVNVTIEN